MVVVGAVAGQSLRGEGKNLDVVRAICRAVAEQTGRDQKSIESAIEFVTDRPGHDRRYALKTDKIKGELGWSARTEFAVGLESTVRWYLDHPEWIARVTSGE